jgi:hypothetical protein
MNRNQKIRTTKTMRNKPILFSGQMIRALLNGSKTQTRRILPQAHPKFPECNHLSRDVLSDPQEVWYWDGIHKRAGASYRLPISPHDRLWVRETCATWGRGPAPEPVEYPVAYAADDPTWEYIKHDARNSSDDAWKIRSSIHMPRWASRLTLIVTDVRVQRLQDIKALDALAEGIEAYGGTDPDCHGFLNYANQSEDGYWLPPVQSFRTLWNSIHGPDAWDKSPWVAAYTFTVHKCNIDQLDEPS